MDAIVEQADAIEIERYRLSPLSLIAKTITSLRSIILPLVAVSIGAGSKIGILAIILILIAIILITFTFTWLSWRRFSYQIGQDGILIESGILSRNARSIPYERVQDVSVEQKLIPRLLGLAAVKFETGGGEGDEGKLEYVLYDEAENLRLLIRARKSGVTIKDSESIATHTDDEISEDESIFSMNVKRIFTLGIFNFSLVLFAVIIGALQQFDFLLPFGLEEIIDGFIDRVESDKLQNQDFMNGFNLVYGLFGVFGGLFTVIIIGMLSGQVQTFLREYGFILTQTDQGIRRRRGLITLTDVVMPLHRVQAAIIQTGPIRKRFGWHALKFTSLGSDTGKESSHMMAPLAKDYEYLPIAKRASINIPNADINYLHSHISYMTAYVILGLFFILLTLVEILWDADVGPLQWAWVITIIPITIGLLSWRYHLHMFDDRQIYVRSGFWNQKLTILPLIKTQSVDIVQGPLSQILGVGDIKFGIAGGSGLTTLTIHNIPLDIAYIIRKQCIDAAKDIDFSALIRAPK